ncbi:MAG: hypothetical protein HY033_10225 [Ignavibacteriae bacterium]|nr:hypothetical protein [Ignavibacteria bacterium]MBI3365272.1 hypothetical protein [Ignavibacteriota bacterium]
MANLGILELIILFLIIYGFYHLIFRRTARIPIILSHWHHLTENLTESTQEFYGQLELAIGARNLDVVNWSRVEFHEGGALSAKRQYLRVIRREHIFDICAAPYGNGFFISWWLGEELGWFLKIVSAIPLIGQYLLRVFRPQTYYRLDTATMFQESIHGAVVEVLEGRTKAKGLKALSEGERKPIMTDFFAKLR